MASPRRSAGLITEPGLLCSVGRPEGGAAPISVVAYPADQSLSDLHRLLDEGGWETEGLMAEARALRRFKARERLARTNLGHPPVLPDDGRPRILVVDRTADETFLGAPEEPDSLYQALLRAAHTDNPDARIIVWRERPRRTALGPDTDGFFHIDGEVDMVALASAVDAIYTVASLAGLEGILLGKRVVCGGRPFYAGRGLTEDRAPGGGRRQIDADTLFAAAYLLFPRYTDPLTGEACSPRTGFRRLAAMTRHARRVRGDWAGLNMAPAKHGMMRAFLGGPMSTYRPGGEAGRFAAWASRPNAAVRDALAAGRQVTFVEDGFLRSVGLGSSFHLASSLILDELGIYYDPSRPSALEHMLNTETFDDEAVTEAAALRERIVALRLSKYNLGGASLRLPPEAAGRRTILVPGQVANDASVLTGGGGLSNLDLLQRVRRDNPGAYLIYKPHPDVEAGQRPGRVAAPDLARLTDLVVSGRDIAACIEVVDEVHTLTSLAGFEALLRGRPVTCYGWPFYAGWGLTTDKGQSPGPRRRTVSLDALVAASLIRYPLYLDPLTWLPCDAETFVNRLAETAASAPADRRQAPWSRLTRFGKALQHILRPPRPPVY